MKLSRLAVTGFLICMTVVSTALARKPSSPAAFAVAGIYDNFTVGKESGDLEGMRVVIVAAGGGYYAIVQITQGGAEDPKPEFVAAKVKGMSVEFTAGSEKFRGTISAGGLTLKNSAGESQTLKESLADLILSKLQARFRRTCRKPGSRRNQLPSLLEGGISQRG